LRDILQTVTKDGGFMKRTKRSDDYTLVILLAYFHRYGWLAVVGGLSYLFDFGYLFSMCMIVYALWTFIGYKCRWKHIFCSYQNACHKKMTPDRINWSIVRKSDVYVVSLLFMFGGLLLFAAIFFNL